jgi:UDP-N-acetylmuramoylalanine--D-glutamate ligase
VRWYNDSKGTNVGATRAALSGMLGKVILIAGGEGKGADFSDLAPVVEEKARAVVLMGADAEVIARALKGHTEIVFAENMEDAVIKARHLAQEGDAVLLSPACASFDMFVDYQQRGEIFMQMVERYA